MVWAKRAYVVPGLLTVIALACSSGYAHFAFVADPTAKCLFNDILAQVIGSALKIILFFDPFMGNCLARAQPQVRVGQGRHANTAAQTARAKLNWHRVIQVVARILRLRRRWAALGRYLQGPRIQDLVLGLERRQGQLVRRRPAPVLH